MRMTRSSTNRYRHYLLLFYLAFVPLLLLSSCDLLRREPAATVVSPPPEVIVTTVRPQSVPLYGEYVARTEALETVDIMARVDGFLDDIRFSEGIEVDAGQLLFVIDKRPFAVALDEARGNLALATATLNRARKDEQRLMPLVGEQAAPQMDLEHAQAEIEIGEASLKRAQAAIAQAELNLGFTEVRAPIAGMIGKQEVAAGNVVRRDQTRLATISSWDPMRVVFSLGETDFLRRIRQSENGTPFIAADDAPFELILSDGSRYPFKGSLGFLDRTINPTTGTLSVYANFPNPERLLRPGLFGRVRVKLEERADALLVPQRSVQVIQGVTSVLVVEPNDSVSLRTVTLGPRYRDYFIITEGLKAGDQVIVEGLHNAMPMPGRTVSPRSQIVGEPAVRE
jgi:RND family efflux transporter MFP subunit